MAEREHFRLQFPPEATLALATDHGTFQVTEISERGIRIAADADQRWEEGDLVRGKLELLSGGEVRISGRHARYEEDEAIVTEVTGISIQEMLAEQRYLITWFPDHMGRNANSETATPETQTPS